jgi:hypothetical protein
LPPFHEEHGQKIAIKIDSRQYATTNAMISTVVCAAATIRINKGTHNERRLKPNQAIH